MKWHDQLATDATCCVGASPLCVVAKGCTMLRRVGFMKIWSCNDAKPVSTARCVLVPQAEGVRVLPCLVRRIMYQLTLSSSTLPSRAAVSALQV